LRDQIQINSIHSFGVLFDEVVDRRNVTLRAGIGLGSGKRRHEAENRCEQSAGDHSATSLFERWVGRCQQIGSVERLLA